MSELVSQELKPCPFCGGIRLTVQYFGQPACAYGVICDECGGGGPLVSASDSVSGSGAGAPCFDNPAALSGWNLRSPGWIPVTERMPDGGVNVLGYDAVHECSFEALVSYTTGRMVWAVDGNDDGDVTHWMPMPEKPEGS